MNKKKQKSIFKIGMSLLTALLISGIIIWKVPQFRLVSFRWIFESPERKQLNTPADTTGIVVEKDIPYINDGDRGHLLDIYRPENADDTTPVVVNIHGGGLFASYKEVNRDYGFEWVRKGYTVVNISYRRLPETTLWHQIDDCMNALRYIDANRKELGLNLDTSYLTGDSAGALLSLFTNSINESPELQADFGIKGTNIRFKAMGLISIMLETDRHDFMDFITPLVINESDRDQAYYSYLLNPSSLVAKTTLPPVYLVTGDEDLIQNETLKLKSLLAQNNVHHDLKDYPKGDKHKLDHVFAIKNPKWEESQEVIQLMNDFFKEHQQ
ncbi:alpha/beta hydrolase [Streptococcus himalayensis]|uniref:Esterase n=1 Tax=Streptococcus himalayensis TaxID=1888195 RepID=A0A917EGZ1_9STRE|nr:alpha/beta hydrolase [Streptococcus himalayensis]GGE38289.1 esterase [Streptococcus himalayensis]